MLPLNNEIFDCSTLWVANQNQVFQRYKSKYFALKQHCLFLSFSLPVSFSPVLSFKRFSHTHETPRFARKPAAPVTLVLHVTPSGPQLKTIKHCWNFLLSIPACVKANKSPGSTVHPSFSFRLEALFLLVFSFGSSLAEDTGWCFGNLLSLLVRMLAFFMWRGLTERTGVFPVWLRAQRRITTDPCKECRGFELINIVLEWLLFELSE